MLVALKALYEEGMAMPIYAALRQRVLATLPPGVDAGPVLWGLAYAALQGGVQGANIATTSWVCAILGEGGVWNHRRGITRREAPVTM
jgi:hypothetical protein